MAQMSQELIPTRATLLERLKDLQDQSSWQDFFDTYWKLIYGVAAKGGLTPSEAQDVVQETMISVAKHMPGFKYDPSVGSFKGWLLTMTRWRMKDQFRKRGTQEYTDNIAATDFTAEKNAPLADSELEKLWDLEWEDNLLKSAVAKARRRLDPQYYQIFDFNVNKGWPADQIAKMFAIPIGQVYLAKHRVADMIRQEVVRLKKEVV